MNPVRPTVSPYLGNRRNFNPTITTALPPNHQLLEQTQPYGQQTQPYGQQTQHGESGFTNYGFQHENQAIPDQSRENAQYYKNTPTQTLQIPNTRLPRSVSDSAIHNSFQPNTQHLSQTERHPMGHVTPHMTEFRPANEEIQSPSQAQRNWMNSPGINDVIQGHHSFLIPRANLVNDQQSHSSMSELNNDSDTNRLLQHNTRRMNTSSEI